MTSDLGAGMKYNSHQWLLAIPCYICLPQGRCKTLDGLLVKIIGFLFGHLSKFSTSSLKLSTALSGATSNSSVRSLVLMPVGDDVVTV